jgi:Zn-dependent M28 family amino/carboxypeptidase
LRYLQLSGAWWNHANAPFPGRTRSAQLLRQYFEQDGCTGDNLTDQPVKHVKIPNLICTAPGETDRVIIVGAHMDCVDAGDGAIDNWTGASLLPALYTSLKGKPRRHRFLFIGFTEEEKGLVGSDFYVRHLSAHEREQISGMVNMDSLGVSTTEVELIHGDKAMLKLPLTPMDFHKVGRSDSDSFQNVHIPAIMLPLPDYRDSPSAAFTG